MDALAISLSPEDRQRLEALAARIGLTLEACTELAVQDFVRHWEEYLRTVDAMLNEQRPVLRAVNE